MTHSVRNISEAHAIKCEMAAEVLRSSGSLQLKVTGWSMLPTVWPGDTLVLERADANSVREGDIVLTARNRNLCAHRVVKKTAARGVLTQGDSMRNTDPPVNSKNLLGKVSYILRDGSCIVPRRSLRASEKAVAALVKHSDVAARVIMGVHNLRAQKI